jgi:hypothetical protein
MVFISVDSNRLIFSLKRLCVRVWILRMMGNPLSESILYYFCSGFALDRSIKNVYSQGRAEYIYIYAFMIISSPLYSKNDRKTELQR